MRTTIARNSYNNNNNIIIIHRFVQRHSAVASEKALTDGRTDGRTYNKTSVYIVHSNFYYVVNIKTLVL